MQSNNTSHDASAHLQRKPIAFEVAIFISSLPPQVGTESADIESSYTFCVRYFNKTNGFGLVSSVKKSQVFKVRSKIGLDTLKGFKSSQYQALKLRNVEIQNDSVRTSYLLEEFIIFQQIKLKIEPLLLNYEAFILTQVK